MASHEIGPIRPVFTGATRLNPAAGATSAPARAASTAAAAGGLALSDALDPGAPPVDAQRVAEIRKAIEQGTYPLVPHRIADAMIAAGMFLRTGK
ncbi:flagellar biosynthesis anti-sigma factor FlgM [Croceicoccus marinus]|uniref:Negative regulator of flagellin synthesis n=1 Tax=Croceicoccus marinus TaxID=450378 RepID=A0A1Z1FB19_9SPHN|nr:flagellar biosynthesis anti-sigma factor FlgM [Croceicoccus marinus]ARU15942.1 flagellar biosynthesis anti-sigma factor FlgM [Croceicoccus marinus]